MGRRRKGRDVDGWVIVDKPAGIGSTDVVGKIRWAFEARKAGHAGTLDPAATGLLAVALGEATKTIPCIAEGLKTYDFTVRFGASTSTDDAEGEIIGTSDERPTDEAILAALPALTGDILQTPPQVSAVKIDGARAYDLVRDGATLEIAPRPLHVRSLCLLDRPDVDHATFRMVCGKGGYVRSIARDLGAALGCRGHVLWLRRLAAEPFDLFAACTLDQIETLARTPGIDALLRPIEDALCALPRLDVPDAAAGRIANGNPVEVQTAPDDDGAAWASFDGRAIAIGTCRAGTFHPARVLRRSDAA